MTDVLQSQAKPSSPEFRENRDHHLQTIEEVASHVAAARQGGGEEACARHHKRGKLLPRERSAFLNLGELLGWLGRAHAANVTYALAVQRGVWAHPQQRPSHRP